MLGTSHPLRGRCLIDVVVLSSVCITLKIRISCAPPSISPLPCPGRPCPFLFYFMTHTSSNSPPKFLPLLHGCCPDHALATYILWGPTGGTQPGLMNQAMPCLMLVGTRLPDLDWMKHAGWLAAGRGAQ